MKLQLSSQRTYYYYQLFLYLSQLHSTFLILKTEQKEIEALEVELKEKKVLLVKFEKDLENTQVFNL